MEISSSIFRTIKTSNWFSQYGQKDPLSAFKKEAFVLFEGLLAKIKNDIVKLLLNLNIIISTNEEDKLKKDRSGIIIIKSCRNERCPCIRKNLKIVTETFKFFKSF